jgi:drug/metabolite transporter (DMT)-like permease
MNQLKGSIFAFLGTSIFAVNFVSMKILVDIFPSMLLIAMRFLIASTFLFLLCKILKLDLKIHSKRDLKEFIITGFLGMSFYYILFTFALRFISAPLSSLLCSMIPLLTAFIYSFTSKTNVDYFALICFIISIIGVYLAIDLKALQNNPVYLFLGVILMFFGLLGWIFYTLRVESIVNRYHSLVMLMYQSLAGGIINLFLTIFQKETFHFITNFSISSEVIIHLLFVSLLGSAIGYYFFNLGIEYLGVTISSAYNNIMPGITLLTSSLLLGSSITPRKIVGILIVILMTFLVTFKNKLLLKYNSQKKIA